MFCYLGPRYIKRIVNTVVILLVLLAYNTVFTTFIASDVTYCFFCKRLQQVAQRSGKICQWQTVLSIISDTAKWEILFCIFLTRPFLGFWSKLCLRSIVSLRARRTFHLYNFYMYFCDFTRYFLCVPNIKVWKQEGLKKWIDL